MAAANIRVSAEHFTRANLRALGGALDDLRVHLESADGLHVATTESVIPDCGADNGASGLFASRFRLQNFRKIGKRNECDSGRRFRHSETSRWRENPP